MELSKELTKDNGHKLYTKYDSIILVGELRKLCLGVSSRDEGVFTKSSHFVKFYFELVSPKIVRAQYFPLFFKSDNFTSLRIDQTMNIVLHKNELPNTVWPLAKNTESCQHCRPLMVLRK